MATELLQPGVSVIQEFRSVSPTVVTPTLVPCAVAPCFQVLEALEADATGNQVLNTDAVASVPAIQDCDNPSPYAGLHGLTLKVSINNGPAQTFTFSDPTALGLNAGQCKDQINSSIPAPAGFGAYVVTSGATEYLQLRTTAVGDGQTLKILDGTSNSVFGYNDNYLAAGLSNYAQDALHIEQSNFPDPRGIIDELDVDEDSIRTFVNTGQALLEFKRDETFLRKYKECIYTSGTITFPTTTLTGLKFAFVDGVGGTTQEYTFVGEQADVAALAATMNAFIGSTKVYVNGADKIDFITSEGYFEVVAPSADSGHAIIKWTDADKAYTVEPVDDGDGDTTTPYIIVDQDNFATPPGAAQLIGSATLTGAQAVHNTTLQVAVDGAPMQEVLFDAGPLVGGAIYNAANTLTGEVLTLQVNGTQKIVTFSGGDPIVIATAIAQINAAAGTVVAYESNAAGVETASGGYLALQVGGGTAIPGGSIVMEYAGAGDDNTWTDLGYAAAISADNVQTMTITEMITQINDTMGAGFASNDGADALQLDSSTTGEESKIEIGNGTANTPVGFTFEQIANGNPYPPAVGDAIYGDGILVGYVAVVAPGGYNNRLKLDREVALTWGAASMYIQALGIPVPKPATRPTPDMVVNLSGAVDVKHDVLRDTEGNPIEALGQFIVAYSALRLDVTSAAQSPGLLNFDDVLTLEETLEPINADNPLGLMLYFSLINAPGIVVAGMGVDGTSANNPDGTPEAYAKALSFLESEEVYALAPASQDPVVHQMFATHVNSISEPDAKGERIVFINPEMPGEALPTLVSSGTDADSTAVLNELETKLSGLAADVLAAGINPVGTIDVSEGLYLDLATDSYKYSISSISGTKVNIRVAFAPGENDDNFYATSNLPGDLISATFTVYMRGQALLTVAGDPDYENIAQAYQDLGNTYGFRRVLMVAPEQVASNIDGAEQLIPGYYLCSAISGMVGQLPPQQGFTNYPIAGFTRVKGSNDAFNQRQMNIGAAGGTYWVIQEVDGGPLTCRHQLTTDLTSIETRELSITKVVDFTAKFMRAGLRNFIGKFNITQPFLDTLSTVVQGQISFLTEAGVLIGGDINNIIQDTDAPDTVLIDVTLDCPVPCNYIRLTLVI